MKQVTAISCTFVLMLVGCWEARFSTSRTLSLNIVARTAAREETPTIESPELTEALKLIETKLFSAGFTQETAMKHNATANYVKYDVAGFREPGTVSVSIARNQLDITFLELGNRTGHLSAAIMRLFDSMEKELKQRFGAELIKIHADDG